MLEHWKGVLSWNAINWTKNAYVSHSQSPIMTACPSWRRRPAERWRGISAGSYTGISGNRIITLPTKKPFQRVVPDVLAGVFKVPLAADNMVIIMLLPDGFT